MVHVAEQLRLGQTDAKVVHCADALEHDRIEWPHSQLLQALVGWQKDIYRTTPRGLQWHVSLMTRLEVGKGTVAHVP
jgi:hypothetical protein